MRPALPKAAKPGMDHLTPPHGGELCTLLVDAERAEQLKAESGGRRAARMGALREDKLNQW